MDFEGLKGRLLSVSYIPLEGEPKFENMLKDIYRIFKEYEQKGKVRLEYDTEVYYGILE